jgi:hypothetical protein
MKLTSISSLLFFALFAISCGELHDTESPTLNASSRGTTNDLQQCMDSKMEQWYRAFNHYQLEGYNMFAADLKALQEANTVYENCRAKNETNAPGETALN